MAQPRFDFPLQPLLEHRKQLERDKQLAVAAVQARINKLVAKIEGAQQAIAGENFRLTTEQLAGALDMAYIANQKRYVGSLRMLIASTAQQLAGVEREMAAARAELLEAAKARKVIEKLRDKQHQRWLDEQNRKEAAALDEIGTQLAIRKRNQDNAPLADAV